MALMELNRAEIDAVSGAAEGDVTVISGPGGTVATVDMGDGTSIQFVWDANGNFSHFEVIATPQITHA